jgi:hypothetical protein
LARVVLEAMAVREYWAVVLAILPTRSITIKNEYIGIGRVNTWRRLSRRRTIRHRNVIIAVLFLNFCARRASFGHGNLIPIW